MSSSVTGQLLQRVLAELEQTSVRLVGVREQLLDRRDDRLGLRLRCCLGRLGGMAAVSARLARTARMRRGRRRRRERSLSLCRAHHWATARVASCRARLWFGMVSSLNVLPLAVGSRNPAYHASVSFDSVGAPRHALCALQVAAASSASDAIRRTLNWSWGRRSFRSGSTGATRVSPASRPAPSR